MPTPREHADAETLRIVDALLPTRCKVPSVTELRSHVQAAVFPLALRCEDLAAQVAHYERRERDMRRLVREDLEAVLVDWVDNGGGR